MKAPEFMFQLEEKPIFVQLNIENHLYNLSNHTELTRRKVIIPMTLMVSLYLLPYDTVLTKLEEYVYLIVGSYFNRAEPYLKERFYDEVPILMHALTVIRESLNKDILTIQPNINVKTLSTSGLVNNTLLLVNDPNNIVKELYKNYVGELFNYQFYKEHNLI